MVEQLRHEWGILALVPDDWPAAWQRRHHVLTRLAREVPVAWISPALHWRERLRHTRRSASAPHGEMFVLGAADGIPGIRRPAALSAALRHRRARRGADWLRRQGCLGIELQLWLPEFADALDWGLHSSASYHIDDEYTWSTVDTAMPARERALIERVDRVFVSSPKLLERKGGINPRTMFSPNGVDYAAFSTPAPEPAALARIPRPRAGYVGVLKEQLDWDLLIGLATHRPEWSFVFVGPVRAVHESMRSSLARIERLPNVHLLGERLPRELPGYVQHLDVSLLPYRRNDYTDAINPMKLYESLAAGTPVVASRIRSVESFGASIAIADGVDSWSSAIEGALSPEATSEESRRARQAVASQYDWDAIAMELLPAGVR